MFCKKIKLTNFRNIENEEISFIDGVNVLEGSNAQGKTNLLEAIYYCAMGKSFRAQVMSDLIKFGENYAYIELIYEDSKRDNKLELIISKDKGRQIKKNNFRLDKLSDLVGEFKAVLFCPEHLSMIQDGPAQRRNYLDIAICRINSTYLHNLQKYTYYLKQRNIIIKNAISDRKTFEDTIEIYSEELAKACAYIAKERNKFLLRAGVFVNESIKEMTEGKEDAVLVYQGRNKDKNYDDEEELRKIFYSQLMSNHQKEIQVGSTLYGVHKDDFDIKISDLQARVYASQGQQRSLALALKIAEGEITKETYGDYPVFLFDDVLSELDEKRRKYMLEKMLDKQVIITTCEKEVIKNTYGKRIISVENGKYVKKEF